MMHTPVEKLRDVGFVKVGCWSLMNGDLSFTLHAFANRTQVLYAFVEGTGVLYVGKTVKRLTQRMGQYRKPGPSQRTNQKANANLRVLLGQGRAVDIWAFADDHPSQHGSFRLNLAAGLEDSIIEILSPPGTAMLATRPSSNK